MASLALSQQDPLQAREHKSDQALEEEKEGHNVACCKDRYRCQGPQFRTNDNVQSFRSKI